jgi:lipopolysaccharide/colanic/teichoic acid biosynthesis glycosyltransferase
MRILAFVEEEPVIRTLIERGKIIMNLPEHILREKESARAGNLMKLMARSYENDHTFYDETQFRHMLRVERMRTERTKNPFLLLLLDISKLMDKYDQRETLSSIMKVLFPSLREIDVRGWYHNHRTIGIIFTEFATQQDTFIDLIIHKTHDCFCKKLDPDWIDKIEISCHLFPEVSGVSLNGEKFNINLYPDLTKHGSGKNFSLAVKKVIDVLGSAFAIFLFSPLFLMIAAAIKATSPGPVFFKQERVGFNGKTFTMLKFRSMKANCDPTQHQNYIKKYINDQNNAAVEPGIFKLTNDSRITPIGSFLRKTSMDEIPQLLNVLTGDMSLVGPRPPLSYECDLYDIWHRRRLLSCKPGITGLWQVLGRSRTTFDDMVRLDLKYIREWHLWLDIKILLLTPKAVLKGTGAV